MTFFKGYTIMRKYLSLRDINGLVESVSRGFEGLHWGYGIWEINVKGRFILDFLLTSDLTIANTCFRKRDEHFITYKSGVACSRIDFFLIRKLVRKICLDCKFIPKESLTTKHKVLVMDVKVKRNAKRKSHNGARQIKWWHFKGEKQRIFQHKVL